jgi:hypothetical protein
MRKQPKPWKEKLTHKIKFFMCLAFMGLLWGSPAARRYLFCPAVIYWAIIVIVATEEEGPDMVPARVNLRQDVI